MAPFISSWVFTLHYGRPGCDHVKSSTAGKPARFVAPRVCPVIILESFEHTPIARALLRVHYKTPNAYGQTQAPLAERFGQEIQRSKPYLSYVERLHRICCFFCDLGV